MYSFTFPDCSARARHFASCRNQAPSQLPGNRLAIRSSESPRCSRYSRPTVVQRWTTRDMTLILASFTTTDLVVVADQRVTTVQPRRAPVYRDGVNKVVSLGG